MLQILKKAINEISYSLEQKNNNNLNNYNIKFRRSIYASKDINKNEKLTKQNIETLRPNVGISAEKYFKVLGKKTKKKINKNSPIFKSDLK